MIVHFQKTNLELHPNELALILAVRNKFRFGEVIVIVRDGVPQRLKKVEIFEDLNQPVDIPIDV